MARLNQTAAWQMFVEWCQSRGLTPLPANPWTVAAYARWCETRHRYKTILTHIKAIANMHARKYRKRPDRHPTVAATLNGIEARQANAKMVEAQQAALFRDEDFAFEMDPAARVPSKRKAGSKSEAAADAARKAAGGLKNALRASPRLVSRRPRTT